MAWIDDYIANPQRALIDAAADPVFRHFIEPADLETVVYDAGGGMQGQAQALRRSAVEKVLRKLFDLARQAQVDLLHMICAPTEFNLCHQLKYSLPGVTMTELHRFMTGRFGPATTAALGVFTAFSPLLVAAVVGKFLAILAVLGVAHQAFAELCRCPED